MPKRSHQPKAKSALQRSGWPKPGADAEEAFDTFLTAYGDKYPKAAATLAAVPRGI